VNKTVISNGQDVREQKTLTMLVVKIMGVFMGAIRHVLKTLAENYTVIKTEFANNIPYYSVLT
jgi:hypothetical protein